MYVCLMLVCLKLLLLSISLFKYWRVSLGRVSAWLEHEQVLGMMFEWREHKLGISMDLA